MSGRSAEKVAAWRRQSKQKLVNAHGGKCIDCEYIGPAFMYDFHHRDPEEKVFGLSSAGLSRSYDKQYEESLKCDLVCANCHRMRTHKQRCSGCINCISAL